MPDHLRYFLLWAAALLAGGVFSASREALTAADSNVLRRATEANGGRWGAKAAKTAEKPYLFATAMDICCTGLLATLTLSIYLFISGGVYTPVPAALLASLTAVPAFVLISVAMPRHAARRRPYGVLRVLFLPAWAVHIVLWPVCLMLDGLARIALLPLGVGRGQETGPVSEDGIRAMVDMGGESGAIEAAEKQMIENVFEFNNLTAEDIMVHRTDMCVLWEEDTDEEIFAAIRSSGLSRFPMCREDVDDVIGILSTRDYLLNFHSQSPKPVRTLLRNAYFVPETVKADALFRDMQRQKIHMAVVVDEYGGTSGLLTMEDLLEQLVGEIYDEFDAEDAPDIIKLGDNLWRISGGADLEAVSDALGVRLPEDDEYDTLGGLVFSKLTVIPDDGSGVTVDVLGLHIAVERIHDRRVEWALVSKAEAETAEAEVQD